MLLGDFQQKVKDFMVAAGQKVAEKPQPLDLETAHLRIRLCREELLELESALHEGCIVCTADAISDLLYVVIGTANACGVNIEPIFNEVHRSNMTKFIDGHMDEGGKWIKGPSYSPADLMKFFSAKELVNSPHCEMKIIKPI